MLNVSWIGGPRCARPPAKPANQTLAISPIPSDLIWHHQISSDSSSLILLQIRPANQTLAISSDSICSQQSHQLHQISPTPSDLTNSIRSHLTLALLSDSKYPRRIWLHLITSDYIWFNQIQSDSICSRLSLLTPSNSICSRLSLLTPSN